MSNPPESQPLERNEALNVEGFWTAAFDADVSLRLHLATSAQLLCGIDDIWRSKSTHGQIGPAKDRLRDALISAITSDQQENLICRLSSIPTAKSLYERLVKYVKIHDAGTSHLDGKKTDTERQAALQAGNSTSCMAWQRTC